MSEGDSGGGAPLGPDGPASAQGSQVAKVNEFEEDFPPLPGPSIRAEPFNAEQHRENSRTVLAFGLFGLLAATVLFIVCTVIWAHFPVADAEKLFQILLAPLIGLVGAATGFYFGEKEGEKDRKKK